MADQTPQLAPPPGYAPMQSQSVPSAPSAQNSGQLAAPEGYVSTLSADPKQWTPEQVAQQKAKSQNPNVNYTPTSQMTGETGLGGVATGVGKTAAATMSGAAGLVNRGINTILPDYAQLPVPDAVDKPKGLAENIGGLAEQTGEFAEGGEVVDAGVAALSKLANLAKTAPALFDLIKAHPVASKVILGALKGGAVGTAQGATQGQGSGTGAAKGAESGAEGGLIGGAVAEAAPALLQKVSKLIGVGGQTFESAMSQAGRPAISDRNWKQSVDLAKPMILDNIDPKSIKSIDDFVDQVGDLKNDLWKNEIAPPVKKWAGVPVTTTPIAQQIRSTITRSMLKHFPEEASDIEQMANNFVGNSTIGDLSEDLETFNAKLKSYYKMDPQARAAAGKTDGEIAGLEKASDGMRDLLFKELVAKGEKMPDLMRKQYGALADIERVFTKRIPVADRQQPMNMAQLMSIIGGSNEAAVSIASGHPMAAVAGAVPIAAAAAAKARQAPASIIRQGLNAGTPSGPIAKAAATGAKSIIGEAGVKAGEWVKMLMPDGKTAVEVHPEDADEAAKRGLTAVK